MRTLVLVATACLIGGTVEAQGTVERRRTTAEEARRVESEATNMRERVMQRVFVGDSAQMNRATLGLMLGGSPTKRDTLGVFVEGVAEDGPAERAGIFEGHRIAYINNVDVRASAADAGDAYLSSVGQHRLMRAMRDIAPGNTVTLRVWTGSGYRDVQVTTAKYADVFKNQRIRNVRGRHAGRVWLRSRHGAFADDHAADARIPPRAIARGARRSAARPAAQGHGVAPGRAHARAGSRYHADAARSARHGRSGREPRACGARRPTHRSDPGRSQEIHHLTALRPASCALRANCGVWNRPPKGGRFLCR